MAYELQCSDQPQTQEWCIQSSLVHLSIALVLRMPILIYAMMSTLEYHSLPKKMQSPGTILHSLSHGSQPSNLVSSWSIYYNPYVNLIYVMMSTPEYPSLPKKRHLVLYSIHYHMDHNLLTSFILVHLL